MGRFLIPFQAITLWTAYGLSSLTGLAEPTEDVLIKGYTQPKVTIQVAFSQPGKIDALHIDEGMSVTSGQALAELESSSLTAALEIARARAEDDSTVLAARGSLAALRQRLNDLRELAVSGGASNQEVRRVETEWKVAEANLLGAERVLQIQQLEVERLTSEQELRVLRSPIAGFVTRIHKRAGEYVPATEPEVVEVVQLNPLRIRFFVPSQSARGLKDNASVSLHLPALQETVAGVIHSRAPVIDPVSDTVEVIVELANPESNYQAGLMCEWHIPAAAPNTRLPKK